MYQFNIRDIDQRYGRLGGGLSGGDMFRRSVLEVLMKLSVVTSLHDGL